MDADNIEEMVMHRLGSYDISKPTEIILSFDDSDDEESLNHFCDKNSTNNSSPENTNADSQKSDRGANRNERTSITQESDDSNLKTLNSIEENFKELKKNLELPSIESKKVLEGTETVGKNKRKSFDENNLLDNKKRRHYEPESLKIPLKLEPQKVGELCSDFPPEIEKQKSQPPTNEAPEFIYVNKLLYRVSAALLYIIKAFSMHSLVQNSSEEQIQIDNSMTRFLRIKYQLFNLCFGTVENIMVPNANNEGFIRQFIVDTIKLGNEKGIVCLQHQIEMILNELLAWITEKKNSLNNNQPSITQILENHRLESNQPSSNTHPLLKEHLDKPSNPPNNTRPKVDNLKNTTHNISKSRDNSGMPQADFMTASCTNNTPSVTTSADLLMPASASVMSKNIPTTPADNGSVITSNYIPTLPILHRPAMPFKNSHETPVIKTNLAPSNINHAISANNSPIEPSNSNTAVVAITNSGLAQTSKEMALKNLENYVNSTVTPLPGKPVSNVIFSSGPPGQQVSITVDHSVLRQQLQQTNKNITPNHTANFTAIRNSSYWHKAQLYPQNLPQQQHPQQQTHCQKLPPQQFPLQPAQQYLSRSYTIHPLYKVPNNNDPRILASNQPQQSLAYYPQNAIPQNKVSSPYGQLQPQMVPTSTHQNQNMCPRPPPPYKPLEYCEQRPHPETMRSSSNDSGFTSPLHFNSPAPTFAQEDLQYECRPLITHVTSYNPKAVAINDGMCHVCGKSTRLKCMGCYQRYYCTSTCQQIDWFLHMDDCKKSRR